MSALADAVHGRPGRRVVVIGAGVAGCACAAVLAEAGAEVTLVSAALDHVCEPSFGPEVRDAGAGAARLTRAVSGLPHAVQEAWAAAMLRSADGGLSLVDRRLLSIGMKQALESVEGLTLRQGLVVGLKVGSDCRGPAHGVVRGAVEVETAFGETFECDAAVVAVGLGLSDPAPQGGAHRENAGAGADKHGTSRAGGLESCLRGMGAELVYAGVGAGPTYRGGALGGSEGTGRGPGPQRNRRGLPSRRGLEAVQLERARKSPLGVGAEGPPSPYDEDELWAREVWTEDGEGGSRVVVALPDGIATGQLAVAPEYAGQLSDEAEGRTRTGLVLGVMIRPGHMASGLAVANVDETGSVMGRKEPVPVWITGRTAGAKEYVESLEAGISTGLAVARVLLFGGARG